MGCEAPNASISDGLRAFLNIGVSVAPGQRIDANALLRNDRSPSPVCIDRGVSGDNFGTPRAQIVSRLHVRFPILPPLQGQSSRLVSLSLPPRTRAQGGHAHIFRLASNKGATSGQGRL